MLPDAGLYCNILSQDPVYSIHQPLYPLQDHIFLMQSRTASVLTDMWEYEPDIPCLFQISFLSSLIFSTIILLTPKSYQVQNRTKSSFQYKKAHLQ